MHRGLTTIISAGALLGALALAPTAQAVTTVSTAPAARMQAEPGTPVPLVLAPGGNVQTVVQDDAAAARPRTAAATARITVTYHGFTAAAQASFQRAVNTWAANITSAVPVTVDATFAALPTGVLGQAGPGNLLRNFPNAPRTNVWYAEWAANKFAGRQLVPGTPDIIATFSSSRPDWNFSTAAAPTGKIDFQSVVLHELGHGLGFLGAGRVTGATGSVRLSGSPTVYDRHTVNAAGTGLLSVADNSAALKSALTSNAIFMTLPGVAGKFKLYAPSTFQPGSSYSHLDEASFPRGNANSLMTPAIASGETIRTLGRVAKTAVNCFASATC
jgi:hypothetical protein